LGDLGIIGRMLYKMGLKEIGCQSVDWILLAQESVQWQALGTQLRTFVRVHTDNLIAQLGVNIIVHSTVIAPTSWPSPFAVFGMCGETKHS
jgi:hypothetical protein